MLTKQELETAVKVIKEVAGDPVIGVIAELVKDIERASATKKCGLQNLKKHAN